MEKMKTIIDREPLASDYIESRQNFGHVLDQFKTLKPAVWKTPWFYGPVGMAIVAVTISIVSFNSHHLLAEETEVATNVLNEQPSTEITKKDQPESPKEDQVVSVLKNDESSEEETVAENTDEQPVNETAFVPKEDVDYFGKDLDEESLGNGSIGDGNRNSEAVPEVKVEKKKNFLPHIDDFYTGEIPYARLSSGVIECNDEVQIISFKIHYNTPEGTATREVVGNRIPKSVLDQIRRYNIGYMLFITDITGQGTDGKFIKLTSLNFVATE